MNLLLETPIFIILLRSDEARVRHVEQTLVPSLRHYGFANIDIVNAVEGRTYDINWELISNGMTVNPQYLQQGRGGQFACYQSHLHVWRQAIQRGTKNFIVLEDDCLFSHPELLKPAVSELPDNFDFLWLYTPKHQLRSDPAVQIPSKLHLNRTYRQWCTVAYLTNSSYVQTILPRMLQMQNNIDLILSVVLEAKDTVCFSCKQPPFANGGQIEPQNKIRDLDVKAPLRSNIWFTPKSELIKDLSQAEVECCTHTTSNDAVANADTNTRVWSAEEMASLCQTCCPKLYQQSLLDPIHQQLVYQLCVLYHLGGRFCEKLQIKDNNAVPKSKGLIFLGQHPEQAELSQVRTCKHHPIWFEVLADLLSQKQQTLSQALRTRLAKYCRP